MPTQIIRPSAMVSQIILLLTATILSGCASTTPLHDSGALARLWDEKLREYNIWSVFPPREDFSVGDIYLLCLTNESSTESKKSGEEANGTISRPLPLPTFVASIPTGELLEKHYGDRISIPELPVSETLPNGKVPGLPKGNDKNKGPFGKSPGDNRRLRNVSLPEFFTVSLRSNSIGAMAPTPAALLGAGIRSDSFESISITIPTGSSYALPGVELFNAAQRELAPHLSYLVDLINGTANSSNDSCKTRTLIAVNEVYLAHAIDVRFNYDKETATSIRSAISVDPTSRAKETLDSLSPGFSNPEKTDGEAIDEGQNKNGADNKTPKIPGPNAYGDYVQRMKELSDSAKELNSLNQPGVAMSVHSLGSSGITLRRQFVNPVAIGYRGFPLKISSGEDGRLVLTWGSPTPQPAQPTNKETTQ